MEARVRKTYDTTANYRSYSIEIISDNKARIYTKDYSDENDTYILLTQVKYTNVYLLNDIFGISFNQV